MLKQQKYHTAETNQEILITLNKYSENCTKKVKLELLSFDLTLN